MNHPPAVLVAEDNAISREVLSHQLRMLGCLPTCAADGMAAAAAWRSGDFAMLVTDLQMPGLDGFELATLIRAEESGMRMPIVALSASESPLEAARCRSAGMDDCLIKPIPLVLLRTLLERWLGHAMDTKMAPA